MSRNGESAMNVKSGARSAVVMGAGVTGLAAARELARAGFSVLVLEKREREGGLASTERASGLAFDIGSHRIHEQYDPEALRIIRDELRVPLVRRPRSGLIRIGGKMLKYPPSVLQILGAFGGRSAAAFAIDYAAAAVRRFLPAGPAKTFEDYARRAVGDSLYERFYRPYAEKLWDRSPSEISFEPAVNRMKKFEWSAFLREIGARIAGSEASAFYYPENGIGDIAAALLREALALGVRVERSASIGRVAVKGGSVTEISFRDASGAESAARPDVAVSTIPIKDLHALVSVEGERERPELRLEWRALRIVYVLTSGRERAGHETFYFPEGDLRVGRVSDISLYSPALRPADGRSLLTVEIPCTEGDGVWTMDDADAGRLCAGELERCGILRRNRPPDEFFTRRIPDVYPVYDLGWKERFERAYARLAAENLYLIGRPALFLHCNIDHCLVMARRLARHLESGAGREAWEPVRRSFERFQVKD